MATKDIYVATGLINNETAVARVYFDKEWDEYRVKLSINGVAQKKATYHTDNKQDAISTAEFMVGNKKEA